ncbi:MAG: hypothetical protein OQK12_05380 [Motiliproteus sp.]|nr:hypothetical protein [Motiliproteus sp.]MCW9053830.1 hypothetical protein [Motiliproteus sp.]
MLHRDFQNGKKLNLSTSLAIFTIVMGFLFLLDAGAGMHTVMAGAMILFGFAWYFGDHLFHWWDHQHH